MAPTKRTSDAHEEQLSETPCESLLADCPGHDVNILKSESWALNAAYQDIVSKESQLDNYVKNHAPPEILKLVGMNSRVFGCVAERIVCEIFRLGPRTSTQNDGTFQGKKIEVKCARFWSDGDGSDCRWQHLEPEHDYDMALLVLLDYNGFQVGAIQKSYLMSELRVRNVVTHQGKQGWWTKRSDVLSYLTPIHSIADLEAFVQLLSLP